MPPYDRRARQRGFNTRIPIYTLSGGVGRQAPSKRLPSEAQILDNAIPTLERSIEKRSGTNQLSCYKDISADELTSFGALTLPNGTGGTGEVEPIVTTGQFANASFTFSGIGKVNSTLELKSTDETIVTYLMDEFANSGYYTESTAELEFRDSPKVDSTIAIVSESGITKTYIAKADGTVTDGALDGSSNVQFNNGSGKTSSERGNSAATHLQTAIYSAQGHNNNASGTMTFTSTAVVDETITLVSTDGTEKTYIGKSSGTSGALSGSNILFNVGASVSDSATNLAAAINSTNGHNAVNTVGTGTWTHNTGAMTLAATVQLSGLTNLGTTVAKTFKCANSGSNGDLDGLDIIFLQGNSANEIADNLAQAINNKNGFGTFPVWMSASSNTTGVIATATFTFSGPATDTSELAFPDAQGTTKTYKAVSGCGDCPKLNLGKIEFNSGTDRVSAAQNFAEAVNSSVGHNGTVKAYWDRFGKVTLKQTVSGTAGNTSFTTGLTWNDACSINVPSAFTGGTGGGEVVVTQRYAGTAGNTTITDSFPFSLGCSVLPPATLTGGTSTGVNGTKFTTSTSLGEFTVAQVAEGFGATSRITLSAKFTNATSGATKRAPARLGLMSCLVVGKTGRILLSQCVGGDTGNKSIVVNTLFNDSEASVSSAFTRSSYTYCNIGTSATNVADHFATAIASDHGHNGKITAAASTGVLTLTQLTTGKAGNTPLNYTPDFSKSLSVKPTTFSNGANYNVILDDLTIILTDVKGNATAIGFDSSINKAASTKRKAGTKDVTTTENTAEALANAINANDIRITATYTSGSSTVTLRMDDVGGNGTAITANDTYFRTRMFIGGMPEKDFFYYWFSISDSHRYLLVVDYTAVSGSEKLFYVYKVNSASGKIEDQTPALTGQPSDTVYKYVTHKNETKTSREALEAITVGTNIYIVNKFVKAGFSSSDDGVLFDLEGNPTDEPDYKGKEITYYTSSVVDPDGTAFLYIPNRAYSAGTEVYNAYGVWKALTNIRAESTNTFGATDTNETVIPADPGPPIYHTSTDGAAKDPVLDYNIWYPYTATAAAQPNTAIVLDGKNRIQLNVNRTSYDEKEQTAATEWADGMTPSVLVVSNCVTSTCERKWKETTKNSTGVETEEGDLVYDTNHSRKVADKGAGTDEDPIDTATGSQDDEYITLWQYVRAVRQIPIQDNRYVSRSQQFIGQSFSDFSNVKLPPHASDPTDIIDLLEEICHTDDPTYPNRTGDAARTIGILYEDREASDYYDTCGGTTADPNRSHINDHTYGLGKIIFVENSYAGLDPGYYRIDSSIRKPYLSKVRTPFKHSRLGEKRMPHKMVFIPPTDTENAKWDLAPENWLMRISGDAETNPGPKIFEDGKQAEIKAMGFFRNRLWFAGEDKVFSSKLNEINNFWIDDPTSITDEDPIDITCSSNKYTEVVSLTPFEEYLFVNTGSDVQFTLKGSDNQITPFTAEISPTSFYSTAPLVNPVLLGSQIYFFDKERLYVYFNDKTVSINNAIEVSYHCPGYLPEDVKETTVVSPYDTLLFIDNTDRKNLYCYTNRYSGEQVIQNAFFRYVYDKELEAIKNWDNDIYSVIKRTDEPGNIMYHIERQPFIEPDLSVPLVDHRKYIEISTTNTSFNRDTDETTFTFSGYFNDNLDSITIVDPTNNIAVAGEQLKIISTTVSNTDTKVVVNGNYLKWMQAKVYVGTKYKTEIQLSPIFYRDENNNVADGILSIRTMHIRHHNTGNYRVEVLNRGRKTTPIEFSSKEISSRTDLLPLDSYIVDGETVSKILGFGDEVKISLISDYVSPMNITNIELKGRFNATYSSWVR